MMIHGTVSLDTELVRSGNLIGLSTTSDGVQFSMPISESGKFHGVVYGSGSYRWVCSPDSVRLSSALPTSLRLFDAGTFKTQEFTPAAPLQLELQSCQLGGLLRGADGKPLAAKSIHMLGKGYSFRRYTDAHGRFYFKNFPQGDYTLRPERCDGAVFEPRFVRLRGDQQIELRSPTVRSMRLNVQGGEAGRGISVQTIGGASLYRGPAGKITITVPHGRLLLLIQQHSSGWAAYVECEDSNQQEFINVQLQRRMKLHLLLPEDIVQKAGCPIVFERNDGTTVDLPEGASKTRDDGSWIGYLAPGRYRARVRSEGRQFDKWLEMDPERTSSILLNFGDPSSFPHLLLYW